MTRATALGFAVCDAFGVKRHRPGFNRGSWSTVEDDLNCNSAIEDASMPGALRLYPTIHLPGHEEPFRPGASSTSRAVGVCHES